jgi:hypothetical protein
VISNCAQFSFTFISDHCAVHRPLVNVKIAHNVHCCTFFHTEIKTQATWVIIYSKIKPTMCIVASSHLYFLHGSFQLSWPERESLKSLLVVTRICEIYVFEFCLFPLNKFINRSMSNSKRRRIENENRSYPERWECEYLITNNNGKLQCLVSMQVLSVPKEF